MPSSILDMLPDMLKQKLVKSFRNGLDFHPDCSVCLFIYNPDSVRGDPYAATSLPGGSRPTLASVRLVSASSVAAVPATLPIPRLRIQIFHFPIAPKREAPFCAG